ncbi:type VI secretion system Vgr family protein, partial [Brenneria sp. g21c3]|nr:type VI secretion system Vgr family protein [Brenneria sp. g21c3]
PANNKLRMEDERGKEHIKLSTEYGGKSQLNLGHLVDGSRQRRGEGFELRTDQWGAIRAGKGLFISADEQSKAGDKTLEMGAALSLIKGAMSQVTEWRRITQTHRNLQPDADSLKEYQCNADGLKAAALLLSAPAGIGVVSPHVVMLQSGKALYAQSAGEVHIGSAERIGINARQAVSVLSQNEGMRLVSAKGALSIESHADVMDAIALQDITVNSTQGHIQITAKQGITLACGGAYIRLSPKGEIEIHGPSQLSLKGRHKMDAPSGADFPLPELPASVCEDCLKKAQAAAQGFVFRG